MIDTGMIHRCMPLKDVTVEQISEKNEELNTTPGTQVVATQVFQRPEKMQPNSNVKYDALIYYKCRSNITQAMPTEKLIVV